MRIKLSILLLIISGSLFGQSPIKPGYKYLKGPYQFTHPVWIDSLKGSLEVSTDTAGKYAIMLNANNKFQRGPRMGNVGGGGGGSLTSTFVGYGDGSNLLTGSNQMIFNAGNELLIGNSGDLGSYRLQTPNLRIGTGSTSGSATPNAIVFDGDYSTTTALGLKLQLMASSDSIGFGIQAGQLNYAVQYPQEHSFYVGGVKKMFLSYSTALMDVPLSMNSHKITSLTDGTSPGDAVNKSQLDAVISGVHYEAAVKYATTAALPANTYNNGTSGVGATLTATSNGAISVDGVTPSVNDRILVKDEAAQANNGIYTVTTVGDAGTAYVLTRATDFDQSAEITEGDAVFVTVGNTLNGTSWYQSTSGTITMGTTSIVFVQFNTATGGGLADPGGNGIVVRTSLNNTVARTITGTTDEIQVNDGSGVTANPTLTFPSTVDLSTRNLKVGILYDVNLNELLQFGFVSSAINHIQIANAATGNNPQIYGIGNDTDVGIDFFPKGAGKFNFTATASGPTELRLFEDSDNGTNYTGIIGQGTLGANRTITLPDATGTVVLNDNTATLTNKRITERINSTASSSSYTPNADSYDVELLTALAAACTFNNPSGTPTDGQVLTLRIKDNGTARALTWSGSQYRASSDLAFPTTTILSKTMYIRLMWNAADSKWDLLGFINNF